MEILQKLLQSELLVDTIRILVSCLVSFGISQLFAGKYNKGGNRYFLFASRFFIGLAVVLVVLWIIGAL